MIFTRRRLVAKGVLFRAVAVFCFAVGAISTWLFGAETNSTTSRFLIHLEPYPGTILEDRDLRTYDFGGEIVDCRLKRGSELAQHLAEVERARTFILDHWQSKKRAYIIFVYCGVDTISEFHTFIEPADNGEWQIEFRQPVRNTNLGPSERIVATTANGLKLRRDTADDKRRTESSCLALLDSDGEEVGPCL